MTCAPVLKLPDFKVFNIQTDAFGKEWELFYIKADTLLLSIVKN